MENVAGGQFCFLRLASLSTRSQPSEGTIFSRRLSDPRLSYQVTKTEGSVYICNGLRLMCSHPGPDSPAADFSHSTFPLIAGLATPTPQSPQSIIGCDATPQWQGIQLPAQQFTPREGSVLHIVQIILVQVSFTVIHRFSQSQPSITISYSEEVMALWSGVSTTAAPPLTSTARGPLLLLEKMLTGSAAASPLCWIGANKWRCSKAAAGAHLIVFEARLSHLEPWAWSRLTRTRYIVLVPSQRIRGAGTDI